jgi:hypothetical protein
MPFRNSQVASSQVSPLNQSQFTTIPHKHKPVIMATYSSILENIDTTPISLTSKQTHLLNLISSLSETRLSLALLTAPTSSTSTTTTDPTALQAEIKQAEQEALEARVNYTLRERIITQTLIADPLLRAVHSDDGSADTSQLPLLSEIKRAVHTRDVLAMLHGSVSTQLSSFSGRAAAAERDIKIVNTQNAEMARNMIGIAEAVRAPKTEDVEDDKMRAKLEKADEEVVEARRRWRVLKSLTAGVVVGSGADWTGNEDLVELVLDDEDELR